MAKINQYEKAGRPRKDASIKRKAKCFTYAPSNLEALATVAEANNISEAELINRLISHALLNGDKTWN